jgi:predicted ArsR family transcriptional regulator
MIQETKQTSAEYIYALVKEKPRTRDELVALTGLKRTTIYDKLRPHLLDGTVKRYPIWTLGQGRGKPPVVFSTNDPAEDVQTPQNFEQLVMQYLDDGSARTTTEISTVLGIRLQSVWNVIRALRGQNKVACTFTRATGRGGRYMFITKEKVKP